MLWWILSCCCCWKVDILRTPVVSFFPDLKMHHVAILSRDQEVYAMDFTHRDASLCTKVKLLLGATVPAKIRLRKLSPRETTIPDQSVWENASEEEEEVVSDEWTEMNLYTRNCQHFTAALRCTHAE